MSILRIRDADGVIHEVLAIRGKDGKDGKDYILTEEDKQEIAAEVPDYVTPDSIGAAPAGYGYGELIYIGAEAGASLAEKLDAETESWADRDNKQCMLYEADFNGQGIIATISKYNNNQIVVNGVTFNGYQMVRRKIGGTWYDWEWVDPPFAPNTEYRTTDRINGKAVYKKITSSGELQYRLDGETTYSKYTNLIGAAPAGYGLGETDGKECGDLNTAVRPGFYRLTPTPENVPAGYGNNWRWAVLLVQRRVLDVIQTITYNGVTATRMMSLENMSDTTPKSTGPWMYVTPPMENGVEYCTTEKSDENPVYVKRISVTESDISALSSSVTRYINHGISDFKRLVRCHAVMDNAYPLPHISYRSSGNPSIISINNVNMTTIVITAINIEQTAPSFTFDIYYCKQ